MHVYELNYIMLTKMQSMMIITKVNKKHCLLKMSAKSQQFVNQNCIFISLYRHNLLRDTTGKIMKPMKNKDVKIEPWLISVGG